jgi:hypothetical protein
LSDRFVQGYLVFPGDAHVAGAGRACIELRDVSQLDEPSILLSAEHIEGIVVKPGATVAFRIRGPEADPGKSLTLRVQVDIVAPEGEVVVYLTTMAYPVPVKGDADVGAVRLQRR